MSSSKAVTERDQPALTENALTILRDRYLARDKNGKVCETPRELFQRVARAIAAVESPGARMSWEKKFFSLMTGLKFLPNTPTLMNAGKPKGQLSACFVLPVSDNLGGIFETLKNAAVIHQSGGGTGFAFSRVRPRGVRVGSTAGVASGPVAFMKIYDLATETIKQGGVRRGANMGILRVDHPDILEFIELKRDLSVMTNFNISIGVTDPFMDAVERGGKFFLREPGTGAPVGELDARDVFRKAVESAWATGDPGLVFLDRMNLFNPTPDAGDFESTNPCGEQPLLPFESCNLGSLNLGKYYRGVGTAGEFLWDEFREDIQTAIRFLDNVIEANFYPIDECGRITFKNRKIGLGVMGFADLLLMAGIPYDSDEAVRLGEQVMSFLDREAKRASANLAHERGAFPNWRGSTWERLKYPRLRNATVSTVAPTGTISAIAGASSGIEPIFSGVFYRNVLDGKRLLEVHPSVRALAEEKGIRDFSRFSEAEVERLLGKVWRPAAKVSVQGHIRIQAAFQRHSDSAVSKTINLPQSATSDDVERAYLLAYQEGCKGITVYRDRSRPSQVLEASESASCVDCVD